MAHKIFCDMCGAEITRKYERGRYAVTVSTDGLSYTKEYCTKCFNRLRAAAEKELKEKE